MTGRNVWILDNNLLTFVLKAGVDVVVTDAIAQMERSDEVATVEHVLNELKRSGQLWPLWKKSPLSSKVREIEIEVDSDEERHYDAMRTALSAGRGDPGLRDLGERACIAACTTLPGAIFVSHDAGSIRLAVTEMARVCPSTGRVATTAEALRVLHERGALPRSAIEAIVRERGGSKRLPDPSWWLDWLGRC